MIDEKELIKILQKNSIFRIVTNAADKNVYEIIAELPKVGEWIPCSERLPDKEGNYLVTVEVGMSELRMVKKAVLRNKRWYRIGQNNKVIAWMELPPCWEGEE